jgi:sporulation protein YlmC with PRC-barrel domain
MAEEVPIAYEALSKGTPVLTSTGTRIGTVEHVLADSSLDLFDGIVVRTAEGLRFVTADQVGLITTAAVHSRVADADVANLQQPHTGDAVFEADPEQNTGSELNEWFGRHFLREHWTRRKDGE